MLSSFYTAISGLNNNAVSINVIGNNLANINTTAFKAGRTSFAEVLGGVVSTSINGNPIQQGMGSILSSIIPVQKQGVLSSTGRSTDIGISGNGYLVVSAGDGKGFTRAGNLNFNAAGELVSSDGSKVLGYRAVNGLIDRNAGLVQIQISKGTTMPPEATENVNISANLDTRADVGTKFTTTVQVVDSLGCTHDVTMVFTKASALSWDWDATVPATETGGAITDPPVSLGNGSLTFDDSGMLSSPTANETLTLSGLADGAADMDITLGIFDENGNSRFTGFAAESTVSLTVQDGYRASVLSDIIVTSDGTVNGIFGNGVVKPLAQLAIALFANPDGLVKLTGSIYLVSGPSGEPAIGTAGSGGRGMITAAALEQSNVDIAEEFTGLIVAQRGYQANSRIIGTTDELYQEALNLKR